MLAAEYCSTTCPTMRANSAPERLAASLRFHYAKYVCRAAPFILIVLLGRFSRFDRYRWAHVIVQGDRFLIQANDGLAGS